MSQDSLKHALEQFGLNENEASLYLAGLSLGPCTVSSLARAAAVKRTTAYHVIDGLKQKGLFTIELAGFKKLLIAEPAEKLESLLDARKQLLRSLLPEFSAISKLSGGEGYLRFYEGLEAVKSLYSDLVDNLRPGDVYWAISNQDAWLELDREFFEDIKKRRGEKGVTTYLLLQDTPAAQENRKTQQRYNEHVRILPDFMNLQTNFVTTPYRAVFQQTTPPYSAISVENSAIISTVTQMCEVIWHTATA